MTTVFDYKHLFSFDPWQLFGLTPTSKADEARRAYYKLALMMHPDRGGDAEDMRCLHQAFKWVYNQLEGATTPISIDDPTKTPVIDAVIGMDKASLVACYDSLKTTDDERIRTMVLDWVKYIVERDLMTDADLKTVEEYIQESIRVVSEAEGKMYSASIPAGYGNLMETHEEIGDYETAQKHTEPCAHKFSKEMMVYSEPICPGLLYPAEDTLAPPDNKEDYTFETEALKMTDYALAHTKHIISDSVAYEKERLEQLEEKFKKMT